MKVLMSAGASLMIGLWAYAGEISKSSYSSYFEWQSSDCYKPNAPMVFELDDFTRMQIESYLDNVKDYKRCVQNEAEADYSDAMEKLADAMDEGIEEANFDVDTDLRSLETTLMLLD